VTGLGGHDREPARRGRRRAVTVPGLDHGASPFPLAVLSGNLLFSSAVSGRDPVSGVLPETVEEQSATALANVARICAAAGGSVDGVMKVTVFARDRGAVRTALDPPWIRMFPDEDDRPVRHTVAAEMPAGMHLQVEFIALMEESST
jgi:2-iminobutanoate/2-iminopropanoate deaminase